MYAPILILAFYSFTDTANIGAVSHFSLKNYITLFTTEELANMIWGTLFLALGSAVIATILGTIGAIGSYYSRKRSQTFISAVNQVPVVNADVVTGFSICILLVIVFGFSKDSYFPLVAGHVTMCAPFVYLSTLFRRVRMVSLVYVFKFKIIAWAFIHAGVIKYDRDKGFDLSCFKETNGILQGNGIVALFPQGHVLKPGEPVNKFQPGLALFSLKHHAPIIPYYYKTPNKAFRVSHLVIDKPINPDDLFGKDYVVNNELINKFTKYLEDKFLYYETHSVKELMEEAKHGKNNIK